MTAQELADLKNAAVRSALLTKASSLLWQACNNLEHAPANGFKDFPAKLAEAYSLIKQSEFLYKESCDQPF